MADTADEAAAGTRNLQPDTTSTSTPTPTATGDELGTAAAAGSSEDSGAAGVLLIDVLRALAAPLSEEQLWALCHESASTIARLHPCGAEPADARTPPLERANSTASSGSGASGASTALSQRSGSSGSLVPLVASPTTLCLHRDGRVTLLRAKGTAELARYLPDKYDSESDRQRSVFALGATLYTAADYTVPDDEEPSLSEKLENLIAEMTDEDTADRCTLDHVLAACQEGHDRPGAEVLRALTSLASCLAAPVPSSATGGPGGDGSSLHDRIMQSIQERPALKRASERSLGSIKPYVTPHQRLLLEIERQPVELLPVSPSQQTSLRQKERKKIALRSSGTKEKLKLSPTNLDDLLGGWDPETQVQLGFAAEEARVQLEQEQTEAAAAERAAEDAAGQQPDEAAVEAVVTEDSAAIDPAPSDDAASPAPAASPAEPEASYLRVEDISHIRRSLLRAELDTLQLDDPDTYKQLVACRLCSCCKKARFSLLSRPRVCGVCDARACSACASKRSLPGYMFSDGQRPNKPRSVLVCRDCLMYIGGVESSPRSSAHTTPTKPAHPRS